MKLKFKKWIIWNKYFFFIALAVLFFFNPVFRGQIPFPGDLLVSENPYKETSFLGYNPGSIPNKAQGADVIKEIYPWRLFAVESLKKADIPFWNPYNFSGNPQMANFQTAIFYPLNLLYFILPFNAAWTIIIMLQPILAGFFMFLFLRSLKLTEFSSFIGSVAFGFSSYMTVWIQYGNIGHTILWLPFVLFCIKKLSEALSAKYFFLLSLGLTMSFFGGYIQGLFYVYAFSFAYLIYLTGLKNMKKIVIIFFPYIFPILIGALQLLPTLELFSQSTRGNYTIDEIGNLLLPVQSLLTLFAADFFGNPATRNYFLQGTYIERVVYVGVPVLFFALYSFRRKISEWKFFMMSSVVTLIVAVNLPVIKYLYQIPIPVISTTVPTRELSLFIFSAIVLASFGINIWEKMDKKTKAPLFFFMTYLILWIGVFLFKDFFGQNVNVTLRNLVIPSMLAFLTILVFYLKLKLAKTFLTLLVVIDLFYFFNKITPFSPVELVYPQTKLISYLQQNAGINRYWGYGSAYIPANFQTVDETFSPEGNDPLHIANYGKLLASSGNGKIPEVLPRPDANIAPGFGNEDLKNNFFRKKILDLLGVKYIVHKSQTQDLETFPKDSYNLVWSEGALQLYENKNSHSRFSLVNNFIVAPSKEEVLKNIYNENIDLKKTVILEENPVIKIDKNSKNKINLLSYRSNKVIIETVSTGNSLLFISDNHYPDWKAEIDGKKTKILVANYSFRAIEVPKGEHKIIFNYVPQKFNLGLKISLLGIALLLISLYIIRKYEKK